MWRPWDCDTSDSCFFPDVWSSARKLRRLATGRSGATRVTVLGPWISCQLGPLVLCVANSGTLPPHGTSPWPHDLAVQYPRQDGRAPASQLSASKSTQAGSKAWNFLSILLVRASHRLALIQGGGHTRTSSCEACVQATE